MILGWDASTIKGSVWRNVPLVMSFGHAGFATTKSSITMNSIPRRIISWIDTQLLRSNAWYVTIFRSQQRTARSVRLSSQATFAQCVICLMTIGKRRKYFIVMDVVYVELVAVITSSIATRVGVAWQSQRNSIILVRRINWKKTVLFAWKICTPQEMVPICWDVVTPCMANVTVNSEVSHVQCARSQL